MPESVPLLHRTSWHSARGSNWKLALLPSKGLWWAVSPVKELIEVVSRELKSLAVPSKTLVLRNDMFIGGDVAFPEQVAACGAVGERKICEQRILEGLRSQWTLREVPRKFMAAVPHTISPKSLWSLWGRPYCAGNTNILGKRQTYPQSQ